MFRESCKKGEENGKKKTAKLYALLTNAKKCFFFFKN